MLFNDMWLPSRSLPSELVLLQFLLLLKPLIRRMCANMQRIKALLLSKVCVLLVVSHLPFAPVMSE